MSQQSSTITPATAEEVSSAVKQAAADGTKLCTARPDRGQIPRPEAVCFVDFGNMKSVVDYPARDMTITVQAGLPYRELQQILAGEGQQLPVDCFDDSLTIGAFVASDSAGPRQYGYGTLRDYLIGVEAVDGQGRIFHAGGRVVKNVAGYDLCRLLVGSRGALGVITQLTFKVKPLPEKLILRSYHFDDSADFESALDRLNTSASTPVIVDFSYGARHETAQNRPSLVIGVEGSQATCDWQFEQLQSECPGAEVIAFASDTDSDLETHCRDSGHGWKSAEVIIRTLPSSVVPVAKSLAENGYATRGHAGNGIICIHDENKNQDVREVCERIVSERDATVSEWDVDHPAKSTDPHTTRLLAAFDPHSVFTT